MFTFRGWIPKLMEIWKEHVTKPSGDSESRLQLLLLTIQSLRCTDFNPAPLYGSMQSLKYYAEFFSEVLKSTNEREDSSRYFCPYPAFVTSALCETPVETQSLSLHCWSYTEIDRMSVLWTCAESPTPSKGNSVGMHADCHVTEGLLQCLLFY